MSTDVIYALTTEILSVFNACTKHIR